MKKMLKMAVLMAACLLVIPTVHAQTTEQDADLQYATNMLKPGTVAPDFTLPTLVGKNFSLSQLKGKVVVLDFWASWCPDCRKDAPNIVRMYREFKDKGVAFVGVSFDTEKANWEKAIELKVGEVTTDTKSITFDNRKAIWCEMDSSNGCH